MAKLQHAGEHAPDISTAARPASRADVLTAHRRAGRRFQAAGAGSFVREQGNGPAVVCLHGMIGTSFLYRKVLAELAARGLRGVAFDLPGFGLADRPPGYDYSWTGLGRFCVAAVDELGFDRFHLVVHDIGGPVGFELATAMPARIASLTLLNTTIDVADFRSPWTMEPFRHRGIGELWMASLTPPAFRFLMRLQGIGDPAAVSRAELDTYLALIKGPDHGRAFLQIMRSTERTVAKQARYRAAVRDVPYPVQAIWAADDPAMTLAGYGEKARAAAGLARLHTVPGKHFPQEDHAPAIASQIAEFVLLQQNVDPRALKLDPPDPPFGCATSRHDGMQHEEPERRLGVRLSNTPLRRQIRWPLLLSSHGGQSADRIFMQRRTRGERPHLPRIGLSDQRHVQVEQDKRSRMRVPWCGLRTCR